MNLTNYKYIETYDGNDPSQWVFRELYDLDANPAELNNLASQAVHQDILAFS